MLPHFLKLRDPEGRRAPLVVSIPHAGAEIPPDLKKFFVRDDPLLLTRDSDLYVDRLYDFVPSLGGRLLWTTICRYVIDPNRPPDEVDASFVEGAPRLEHPQPLGLVAHKTMAGEPLLTRPLTRAELDHRVQTYYRPFHDTLTQLIAETQKEFGYCIHIEGHSMPSVATEGHPDKGRVRDDVDLGDRRGTSCAREMVEKIRQPFEAAGLRVSLNNPYQGGYITRFFGKPAEGVHSVQIELNRRLYMNEATHEILPQPFDALKKNLHRLISQLREWRPEKKEIR